MLSMKWICLDAIFPLLFFSVYAQAQIDHDLISNFIYYALWMVLKLWINQVVSGDDVTHYNLSNNTLYFSVCKVNRHI